MNFIEHLTFWQWWIFASVLIVIQVVAPNKAYFFWMGVAAIITGVVFLLAPALTWKAQGLTFLLCSVTTIFVWAMYAKRHLASPVSPNQNRRSQQ